MIIFIIFFALMASAALYDFTKLRIPNRLVIVTIAVFFLSYGIDYFFVEIFPFQSILNHVLCAAAVLVVTFALYCFKIFGGGDAKLIPAVALWTGTEGLIPFILAMTIAGSCIALIGLILKKTTIGQKIVTRLSQKLSFKNGWLKALANGENVIPYGIAIAFGGVWSIYFLI